ncbi:hypothetical protein [Sulfitobacter pontiacus]|uniref:hypothetical protein n=1 Tax=Sulfitobacter pontiacus TaxID=60137 RepID=UPI000E9BD16C|nr:hypothetical protein [Sulfitobacter pontiacus]HBU55393.1 hypothetical protein [Sulfitobacter sp.]HCI98531.1 hypothetical protein [Sulfitobacter sp.]
MSDNVAKLVPPAMSEPNQNCIALLESVLNRARSGQTIGVVLVEQGADSHSTWDWGGLCGSFSMIGAMQVAQASLVADQVEDC